MPDAIEKQLKNCPVDVFISHAESDDELVHAFVDLLRAAMEIKPDRIRCTSVDGYRLPTGSEIDSRLRDEIVGARVFAALLTPTSLDSDYVLFELGARWGSRAVLLALLAKGVELSGLCGPLKGFSARRSTPAELYQFLCDIARELKMQMLEPYVYQKQFEAFKIAARGDSGVKSVSRPIMAGYTARDICSELKATPPFQQSVMARQFIGCEVDWDVIFQNGLQFTDDGSIAGCIFKPWDDEGFGASIHCDIDLRLFPQLQVAKVGMPFQVIGRIDSADEFRVRLVGVSIFELIDTGGTRMRCLISAIRTELGEQLSNSFSSHAIQKGILAQICGGQVEGLTTSDNKTIHPQIDSKSKLRRLIVLKTCRHLIESNSLLTQGFKNKIYRIDQEIYTLEDEI